MQLAKNLTLPQMQTQWASQLNPVLANTLIQGNLISNISLKASTPKTVNHLLARKQIGWIVTDNTASCTIWRTKPLNSSTITIESSADTTISLWVF